LLDTPLCMYATFFIHSSIDGRLCRFYDLAIVNSVAIHMGVQVSVLS
jgi:hypothetical protein